MSDTKNISQKTVLITGCSDGGLGAVLAIAFHKAGLHVIATARNPSKMKQLTTLGIKTLTLDVESESSIAACVSEVSDVDILVNNAGASYIMPISDISIPEAKKLFDLNVWSYIAVTQAFLPLLLKSKGMVVNQTSIASAAGMPCFGTYSASKAAISMFSDTLRLELAPFGITVVNLKTGSVESNIFENRKGTLPNTLPAGSIYTPANEAVETCMSGKGIVDAAVPADRWASDVVHDLLQKNPPPNIWRGGEAVLVWFSTILPFGMLDGTIKKKGGFDIVEKIIRK